MRQQISRLGTEVTILVRDKSGENAFSNPEFTYTEDRTAVAVRTYPNRNTEVERASGEDQRDNPLFVFPLGEACVSPPQEGDRVKMNGQVYDISARTDYQTHVEAFASIVSA